MVEKGTITFPRQVTREIRSNTHVDLPEAWVLGVEHKIIVNRDPGPEYIEKVMGRVGKVIESDTDSDPADPYVLALALQLWRENEKACVVTQDIVDRMPLKISMRSACERLGLPVLNTQEFVAEIRELLVP